MKTIILAALAATALVPAATSAQSYGDQRPDPRDQRQDQRQDPRDQRQGPHDQRGDQGRGGYGDPRGARDDRGYGDQRGPQGGQGYAGQRPGGGGDWRDYRRTNPNAFHRGGYRGPSGYRYRPVTPGYRFAPGYYGRNYWLNDWQNYRLARPLGYQRWVRYGNDVVLVDIRSGAVVSVYNGFFF
ncbi:RcnB family protein [Sphingomonas bacterium]|uniref:RcnB family protein n=1 Tax=Sphingomonas bacterium TaxID=1895847 RepID=UPI0015765AB9|nr:RcnB family protein [Sphingomonas bacterium]